jgi:hypothetical protein
MTTTPRELLDTSIAQLQVLSAFLGEQLAGYADESQSSITPETSACQEILVSLGALILKVQAARRHAELRAVTESSLSDNREARTKLNAWARDRYRARRAFP